NACRIFYEPLASFDPHGNLVPVLAADVPSVANGGVAADGTSVRWNLKRGVTWHDGRPVTADDVVFTWEDAADPSLSLGRYRDLSRVEKLDDHAVRVVFPGPTPFWAEAFCGMAAGSILPKHVFAPYRGARVREASHNLQPVGTGPYRWVE